jgi:hypothetical protein
VVWAKSVNPQEKLIEEKELVYKGIMVLSNSRVAPIPPVFCFVLYAAVEQLVSPF